MDRAGAEGVATGDRGAAAFGPGSGSETMGGTPGRPAGCGTEKRKSASTPAKLPIPAAPRSTGPTSPETPLVHSRAAPPSASVPAASAGATPGGGAAACGRTILRASAAAGEMDSAATDVLMLVSSCPADEFFGASEANAGTEGQ